MVSISKDGSFFTIPLEQPRRLAFSLAQNTLSAAVEGRLVIKNRLLFPDRTAEMQRIRPVK
jgi:hypothetical protein